MTPVSVEGVFEVGWVGGGTVVDDSKRQQQGSGSHPHTHSLV